MNRIVVKVQSVSDVITNSSSEIFTIKSDFDLSEIEELIMEYDRAHEYYGDWDKFQNMSWEEKCKYNTCSGDGGEVSISDCYREYSNYVDNAVHWYDEEPLSFEDWAKKYHDCSPEEMKMIFFIDLDHSRYATINFIEENFEVLEHENC